MRLEHDHADFQRLLTVEGRAHLPLRRQFLLYLDPFAYFMDASLGPTGRRERAMSHNRAQRPILLTYIRRWLAIAGCSFAGIASMEVLSSHAPLFIIPAAGFGIACSIAVAVTVCTSAAYLVLGTRTAANRLR